MAATVQHDEAFAVIVTSERKIEIELGATFAEADIEALIASATGVAEALHLLN